MTASARHADSYYAASSLPLPDYPALTGEVTADVCVVGGGFSGLNTALELADRLAVMRTGRMIQIGGDATTGRGEVYIRATYNEGGDSDA
jgi:ribulose 1,5-bisphosphate synthetase/thiazole synthase